ncbi:MAG: hypothetical protein D6705_09415 [Deltaproteobacteria bacterium]|nr:MAG: hypothetical protein D6705_09415 [Deltaproteobacteria bacterium]
MMDGVTSAAHARSDPSPLIRARATQELLAGLDDFEGGLFERVVARAGPDVVAAIEAAHPTTWIPVRQSARVVLAAVEELGTERAPKLWRYFFARRFGRSPLMRGLVGGTVRILGVTPRSLFKHVGRIVDGTYRNLGRTEVSFPEERMARVLLLDVHPEMLEISDYFLALAGALEGFCEIVGEDGSTEVTVDASGGRVRFETRW